MQLQKKAVNIFFLIVFLHFAAGAQPFAAEIAAFKKKDSISFPPQDAILFVGSSSFTKWTDIQNYFPGHTIINRGFGGSTLPDLIRYEQAVIFPYRPKQVVIYCGENDIASADSISGEIVFKRFKRLFQDIRNQFPKIPLVYISMKPCPLRWHMQERLVEGNSLIKKYLKKKKQTKFISVWNSMLDPDGKPREDIFIEDKLHMNAKGYAIWQKIIEPVLIK